MSDHTVTTIPPNMDKTENQTTVTLYFISGFIAIIIFITDLLIPLGVAGGVPYITVILLSLWFPYQNGAFLIAAICSMLTVCGLFFSPPGGEMWKVLINRGLALFAIWVTAILLSQRKLLEKKRDKAVSDLKILRGLLPICASCKMIRDDQGYWNQIETYIKEHTEAEFSHSICPECVKKHYPEFQKRNSILDTP